MRVKLCGRAEDAVDQARRAEGLALVGVRSKAGLGVGAAASISLLSIGKLIGSPVVSHVAVPAATTRRRPGYGQG